MRIEGEKDRREKESERGGGIGNNKGGKILNKFKIAKTIPR